MKNKISDIAVILGKTAVGSIPTVGPLVAEIIGNLIPDFRFKRIFSLLEVLESKIDPAEKAKVEAKMLEEKSIDLMEDGFLQAARALSEERIDYIASLLKNSLTNEELEEIAYKKLLSILGELNDIEVLILNSYSGDMEQQREFRGKHYCILAPVVVNIGSSQEQVDKHAISETHKTNLLRLDLIKKRFAKPKRGELPEFDEKTGMMKSSGYDITSLGRLLLRSIDQEG